MLFRSCIVASIALIDPQQDNVVILEPCPTKIVGTVKSSRPDQMNSIFHERAWVRVKAMRKWSQLG